jgi:hypothetical protein
VYVILRVVPFKNQKIANEIPDNLKDAGNNMLKSSDSLSPDHLPVQDLPKPYFIGFNHSRPNSKDAFTDKPPRVPEEEDYQHPQYFNSSGLRFRAEYDYYSLGLVLLEIGLWTRLNDLIPGDIANYPPAAQQQHWLKHAVPQLKRSMGNLYMESVRTCLSDELMKADDPQQAFDAEVLGRIKLCRA